MFAVVIMAAGNAMATPPCPDFAISVSYANPYCNVTFLHTDGIPLVSLWWAAFWNGTPNVTTGSGFEHALDHLNVAATASSPVSFMDRDRNGGLTQGDILEAWSVGGCGSVPVGGGLLMYQGQNATSLRYFYQAMMLDGYQTPPCGGTSPDYGTPILMILVLGAAFAAPLALLLHLWRRVPRE